jgi:DNA (cytosine-5)-methyltransferase 1
MIREPIVRAYDELVVDNFAGGGGASLGIEWALGRSPDLAINHDPEAIAMHAANHPSTRHLCGDVWDVDPSSVCDGRPVALAWFSPDCKHFSKAKGGKPVEKKIRGLAWVVIRWARAVKPRVIVLENVEEFETWGPLLEDGRPDPMKRGLTFRRWIGQLRAAGYVAEVRQLRACDYGAPTSRKRLFIIARSDGRPIVWPTTTHGPGHAERFGTAADCIDWDLPCPSIFERAKPLAENTLRRIARGIRKYVLESAEPFIVPATHGDTGGRPDTRAHSVDEPLRTIITRGANFHVVDPFLVPLTHAGDERTWPLHEPVRTVTGAHRGEMGLVAPVVMSNMTNNVPRSPAAPLSTILTGNHKFLVSPSLVQTGYGERKGQAPRALDIHKPLGTIIAGGTGGNGKHALVSAFLAKHYGGGYTGPGCACDEPMHTVTAVDHHAVVAAHLQRDFGQSVGSSLASPAPTVTAGGGGHVAEVRAFLLRYYGASKEASLSGPLGTVCTHDRFGIVMVAGEPYAIADIGMRMLSPRELFRAQGFPDSYVIDGLSLSKTAQVRMCGNSVCPPVAAAIVRANVAAGELPAGERRAS